MGARVLVQGRRVAKARKSVVQIRIDDRARSSVNVSMADKILQSSPSVAAYPRPGGYRGRDGPQEPGSDETRSSVNVLMAGTRHRCGQFEPCLLSPGQV